MDHILSYVIITLGVLKALSGMGGAAKRNLQNMALQFRRKREPDVTTQSSSPPPTPNKAKEAPKSPSQSDREDSKLMDYFEV